MATKPCTLGPKHKWAFSHNSAKGSMNSGSSGTIVRLSTMGVYKCACGATRNGATNHGAPGSDLREHLKGL